MQTYITTGFRIASDGTFPTAKRLVPEILDDCPVKTICAFFHKSWRYMDAYRCVTYHLSDSILLLTGRGSIHDKQNMQ